MTYRHPYSSPLGNMTMVSDGIALTALRFDGEHHATASPQEHTQPLPIFDTTQCWLDLYFGGRSPSFTPPIAPRGTAFQRAVWGHVLTIPHGATLSYGAIACRLSPSMSAQAVGGAVGRNPISIIIPCHRVVGAHGTLTGYASGIDRKAWLLQHEGIMLGI
ncbi:MAG: methylated-DNA--[Bacteroidales bacterium]|nr:methylated-DNA--[protein]-cysteine S-methyltransferase [Bacteroidales bacterium]